MSKLVTISCQVIQLVAINHPGRPPCSTRPLDDLKTLISNIVQIFLLYNCTEMFLKLIIIREDRGGPKGYACWALTYPRSNKILVHTPSISKLLSLLIFLVAFDQCAQLLPELLLNALIETYLRGVSTKADSNNIVHL
jgi:hypothetical protein